VSLNPEPFPPGAGLRLCARMEGAEWAPFGILGSGRDLPRSESGSYGSLKIDTDVLSTSEPFSQLELRLEIEAGDLGGSPRLRRLALTGWLEGTPDEARDPQPEAWGCEVADVPQRSQRSLSGDLPTRACSPTSLSMVLAHWGHELGPEDVARRVYDKGAEVYGNWSFNVALASELGLEATVRRWSDLRALEEEVLAGRPVVISHRYEEGELSGAPESTKRTSGHLIVVVGFSKGGDVIVHDPAAEEGEVRRVYARAELERTWLGNAQGIAYQLLARS
jgi:hypothetical protein